MRCVIAYKWSETDRGICSVEFAVTSETDVHIEAERTRLIEKGMHIVHVRFW
jgi:hypothetical protein